MLKAAKSRIVSRLLLDFVHVDVDEILSEILPFVLVATCSSIDSYVSPIHKSYLKMIEYLIDYLYVAPKMLIGLAPQ